MIKRFIFLGAPGVGKGTLARLLQENNGIKHISTGEIFRNEIQKKTKLGLEIEKILISGEYVSNELTNEVVKNALNTKIAKINGFILDGYPRTVNQAKFLELINVNLTGVVLFKATNEKIMERLLNRGRVDDNPTIISKRLKVYNKKTKPLIDFYSEKKLLIRVDVEGNIKENFEKLLEAIY